MTRAMRRGGLASAQRSENAASEVKTLEPCGGPKILRRAPNGTMRPMTTDAAVSGVT